jgi:hypothetical protein
MQQVMLLIPCMSMLWSCVCLIVAVFKVHHMS